MVSHWSTARRGLLPRHRHSLYHAGNRARADRRDLEVLEDLLIVFGDRLKLRLGFHGDDLISASLRAAEQGRQCFAGTLLEIVHQDDALALLVELGHHRLDNLLGTAGPEIERI